MATSKKKKDKQVKINASFEQLIKESVAGNPAPKWLNIKSKKQIDNLKEGDMLKFDPYSNSKVVTPATRQPKEKIYIVDKLFPDKIVFIYSGKTQKDNLAKPLETKTHIDLLNGSWWMKVS